MKGLLAVLLFMSVALAVFTRTLPMPSENLERRIVDELTALERLL